MSDHDWYGSGLGCHHRLSLVTTCYPFRIGRPFANLGLGQVDRIW